MEKFHWEIRICLFPHYVHHVSEFYGDRIRLFDTQKKREEGELVCNIYVFEAWDHSRRGGLKHISPQTINCVEVKFDDS